MSVNTKHCDPELAELAGALRVSADAAWDFVTELPYSTIPEACDGIAIVEWLRAHGWESREVIAREIRESR